MFWWIVIGLIVVAAVFLPLSNWLGKNQRTGEVPLILLAGNKQDMPDSLREVQTKVNITCSQDIPTSCTLLSRTLLT